MHVTSSVSILWMTKICSSKWYFFFFIQVMLSWACVCPLVTSPLCGLICQKHGREMEWDVDAERCPEQLLTGAMCSPPRPISAWLHSWKKIKITQKKASLHCFNPKHFADKNVFCFFFFYRVLYICLVPSSQWILRVSGRNNCIP